MPLKNYRRKGKFLSANQLIIFLMKRSLQILMLVIFSMPVNAQQHIPDSLQQMFVRATDDSTRYYAARDIYTYYEEFNRDSALYYAEVCLSLSRNNNKKLNEVTALCQRAYQELNLGRFGPSLQDLLAAFKIAEDFTSEKNYWKIDT